VTDPYENAITFIRANNGHEIIARIPGYWPVPVGGVVELGDPNRDYGVERVRVRVNSTSTPAKMDLYLDCVLLPTGLGL